MVHHIQLTVEQWRTLAEEGTAPSVKIQLAGHSMRPIIRKNRDYVFIAPLYRPLKKGDVVLFRRFDGVYVVHRLLSIKGNRIQTLGDGCLVADREMSLQSVCGIVTKVERSGKIISLDCKTARLWGRLWMATVQLRRIIVPLWRKGKRMLHEKY